MLTENSSLLNQQLSQAVLNALSESDQSKEIEIQAQEDIETKTQKVKAKNKEEKESKIQHLLTKDLEAFSNLISMISHIDKLTIFFLTHCCSWHQEKMQAQLMLYT